jgi:hypothetical protein
VIFLIVKIQTIFIMYLLLLLIKHCFGDYFLQWSQLSIDKRAKFPLNICALLCHSTIHAGLTGLIFTFVGFPTLIIPLMDGGSHFLIDYGKTKLEKKYKPKTLLIIDQTLHILVYVLIACGIRIATV